VSAANERNAGAEDDRIELEDQFVDLVENCGRQLCTAAQPDVVARFLLEAPDRCRRIVVDQFDCRIR